MTAPSPQDPSDVLCGECGAPMALRPGRYGPFYGCPRWPDCTGTHGAHPDGSPMGVPADRATRQARIRAHAAFDSLWRSGRMTRKQAYSWLCVTMRLTPDTAHIGQFDRAQCDQVVQLVTARVSLTAGATP